MQKKYEGVMSWIEQEIESGKFVQGDKLPSENELMDRFGVSRQTIRRAIEKLTEKGVLEARRGSGTYVSLNTRRYAGGEIRIAVMLTNVDTYIFPSIIKGIEAILFGEGCTLQICVTNNSVEKERMLLKEMIRNHSIDGLIAETVKSGIPSPNMGLYEQVEKTGAAVLFVNSFYRMLNFPHVSLNDRKAGYLATRHLIECGHTEIAGIFKSDDGQGHLRYAGYTEALLENDIRVKDSRVIWMDSEDFKMVGDQSEQNNHILQRLKKCTACVCYNDEIAYKLIEILRNQKISVPEDLSIVGIDNSDLAKFCLVPLTSVKNPVEELGQTAARMIVDHIRKKTEMLTIEFEPELVIRNSVVVHRDL